jgi:S-adenosylmethionine synthetase
MTTPSLVAVSGATGLLGSAITARLSTDLGVLALAHAHPRPGTMPIDLLTPEGLRAMDDARWDALVHCAAMRSPDQCEQQPDLARRFNAELPGRLAALAARRGARMIHISTDYVFDGTHPPYREDDPTAPVNLYGETKRQGEMAVLSAGPTALILRVPALYGEPPPPVVSPMVEEGWAAAMSADETFQDDRLVRMPTNTADVAEVVRFLLSRPDTGLFHCSAPQAATRYQWACAFAAALGRSTDHIRRMEGDPTRKARRPPDARLDTSKLAATGAPLPRPYSAWLPEIVRRRLGG